MVQKQELDVYNPRMLLALVYSKHIVGVLQASAYSLRNEIAELILIAGFIMQHILYVHVERAQKLGDDHFKEFGSLLRIAKGEADSMPVGSKSY